jgi:hypothetical protein
MIPRSNAKFSAFNDAVDTRVFFQMGWNLVSREDAGTRQHIITKLAAETGVAIIKTLTDIMSVSRTDKNTVSIFRDRTLPFFRIISQPDVLSSLILESSVDTIYTFLFGPGGRRGISVFRFTAAALSGMMSERSPSDEEVSIAISSSLAVLGRLIEINQSAHVIEDFNTFTVQWMLARLLSAGVGVIYLAMPVECWNF